MCSEFVLCDAEPVYRSHRTDDESDDDDDDDDDTGGKCMKNIANQVAMDLIVSLAP